jgi:hypothetical protein
MYCYSENETLRCINIHALWDCEGRAGSCIVILKLKPYDASTYMLYGTTEMTDKIPYLLGTCVP